MQSKIRAQGSLAFWLMLSGILLLAVNVYVVYNSYRGSRVHRHQIPPHAAAFAVPDHGPWATVGVESSGFSNLLANSSGLRNCFAVISPTAGVQYPRDAHEHFTKIHEQLDRWVMRSKRHCYSISGFCGPWLEETWIEKAKEAIAKEPMSSAFGPFIPLLVPWLPLWKRSGKDYKDMLAELELLLREDVAYITVSNADNGPFDVTKFPNVLVLSAGGYGHVPLPLFSTELSPLPTEPARRHYFLSFLGTVEYPMGTTTIRPQVMEQVTRWAQERKKSIFIGRADPAGWQHIAANSTLSLSPRGFGRSSYRTTELWQLGLIPIYIWDDEEWFPYASLAARSLPLRGHEIAFSVQVPRLLDLLSNLSTLDPAQLGAMEARVRSLRASHFTLAACLAHIRALVTDHGKSDLSCRSLPVCPTAKLKNSKCLK